MLLAPDSLASRLFSGPLRLPSGAWMSWVSDDGTGFPYPEAAALAVRTAIWWHRHHPGWPLISLIPELRFLEQSLDPSGVVVQRDRGYLFDTAIVLAAMADADAAGVPGSYRPLLPVLRASVATLLAERKATVGGGSCGSTWSACFGPHQVKALALAVKAGALPRGDSLVDSVLTDLLAMQGVDGGFYYPGIDGVLLHAHCYALEGLCMLTHGTSGGPAGQALERGLAFLAQQQGQDGTFPARAGPPRAGQTEGSSCEGQRRNNLPLGPLPGCQGWAGDVTAQAVRLLALLQPAGDLQHRDHGLALCLAPCGLVRYTDGVDHSNSWASLFALQYLWMRSGGSLHPEDLV